MATRRSATTGQFMAQVHELWRTQWSADVASHIGEAAVAHYQAAAKKRAKGTSKVWSGIAKGMAYKLGRGDSKDTRSVIVTVKHIAAMLKEYGGFIKAMGPWSEPSKFHGQKSQFIPIRLRSTSGTKSLGERRNLVFRQRGYPSYDPHYLQSMPLRNLFNVSQREMDKWRTEEARKAGLRGAVKRSGKRGNFAEAQWYERQVSRRYEGLPQVGRDEGGHVVFFEAGETSRDEEQWLHPRWGFIGPTQEPDKLHSDRSKWGEGVVSRLENLFRSIHKEGAAFQKKYGNAAYGNYRMAVLATSRLVFTRSSRRDITPLFILVKQQYMPPTKWMPTPDSTLKACARAMLNRRWKW